jgi:hypothetical protein
MLALPWRPQADSAGYMYGLATIRPGGKMQGGDIAGAVGSIPPPAPMASEEFADTVAGVSAER